MPKTDEALAALDAIRAGRPAGELESATLEFKEMGRSEGDLLKVIADSALCFANASGGMVVVGISESSPGAAALSGCTLDPDVVRRRVWELSRPSLTVDAWTERHAGVPLLFVSVPQSPEIHSDPQGRAPRRLGKSCQPMDPGEQMRLREERLGIDFSAQESGQEISDLLGPALEAARALLGKFADERRKLSRLRTPELLRALGVVDGQRRLTKAGAILFGTPSPSSAPAIVYEFRATPAGEPMAIERLPYPIVTAFQTALDLVRARHRVTPVNLRSGQQVQIEDYPSMAVREALANAVIHRDYHLRGPVSVVHSPQSLVISSPGPLVSGVTPENILVHSSKPRNACLMNGARVLGLAEEIGRGVDRMFREMILSGRMLPMIESSHDSVRVTLPGGDTNTQVARFVAELPEQERDDTDALLVIFRLCSTRTLTAEAIAPVLQKSAAECELTLRRLAEEATSLLEPTRQTARLSFPSYRLRSEALKRLGTAVRYHRRTEDEIDRKVAVHVREYGRINSRTVQNMFDVSVQRARDILRDLVQRKLLRKTSKAQRGPSVEYGAGPRFPASRKRVAE